MLQSRSPSTPLNSDHLELELQNHPDKNFVKYLINGLRHGFETLIPDLSFPNIECKNLLSARQNPDTIDELLSHECDKGYLYGPCSQ